MQALSLVTRDKDKAIVKFAADILNMVNMPILCSTYHAYHTPHTPCTM